MLFVTIVKKIDPNVLVCHSPQTNALLRLNLTEKDFTAAEIGHGLSINTTPEISWNSSSNSITCHDVQTTTRKRKKKE